MKYILTTGSFNIIHPGHIDFLWRAKKLGDKLIVFLDDDQRNKARKHEKCIFSYVERETILWSNKHVDEIIKFSTGIDIGTYLLTRTNFDHSFLFVKGSDWSLNCFEDDVRRVLDRHKIPIAFIPILEGYSTTKLIEKIKNES